MAWLNAAPEDKKPANSKKDRPPPIPRRTRMQRDGITMPMPEIEAGQYLLDWLFEIGPTSPAGMGFAPIAWGEIKSWQHQQGVDLKPWESILLRKLSCEYLSESQEARDPNRPPPYGAMPRNPRLSEKLDAFLD